MSTFVYARYELTRTFRNRRFFVFALGFPLALYYLTAAANRNVDDLGGSGVSAPVYLMVGLAAFGAMNAMLATGGRIAGERALGWNRQLRLTPLPTSTYFRVKLLAGYATALLTIALLYGAGLTLGVRLGVADWAWMTLLLLVGLVPFGALAVLIGHLLTTESVGPALGATTAVFGILGGSWYPITGGVLEKVGQALPSYWLVQASHVGLGGRSWGATGWAVVAVWSVAAAAAARAAYRRDTQRV